MLVELIPVKYLHTCFQCFDTDGPQRTSGLKNSPLKGLRVHDSTLRNLYLGRWESVFWPLSVELV